jgi:hypothetical protein
MAVSRAGTSAISQKPGRTSIWKRWWWIAPSALYLLVLYVLPPPAPLQEGTDQSYQAILTELFLRGAQFGKDVIFTFGPWGFLMQPRGDPRIFPWVIFGRLVLAAGALAGGAAVARRYLRIDWLRAVWLFVFLLLADPIFALPLLLFALASGTEATWKDVRYLVLLPACALAACVKFTALILLASLMLLLLLDGLIRARRLIAISSGLFACFVLFYAGGRQNPANLPAYLIGSVHVTSSFTAAMGIPGPTVELALGVLICAIVPASYLFAVARRKDWRLLPLSLWIPGFFFLSFKQAFVRSDPSHFFAGMVYMLLPGCLAIMVLLLRLEQPVVDTMTAGASYQLRVEFWLVLLATIAGGFMACRKLTESYAVTAASDRIARLPLAFSAARRREVYQSELNELRRRYPLSRLDGTVDLIGYQQFLLPAWGLDVRTHPALQTYAAYNPFLSAKDATFFAEETAPEHVLLGVESLDQHFPAIEDSLSWLSLRAHYVPVGYSGKYLHLRRSGYSVPITQEKILERKIRFGEKLSIPDNGPLWAKINFRLNPVGQLCGILVKLPAIRMRVETAGGARDYRILPENAGAGFLLSPVLDDPAAFERWFSGSRAGHAYVRQVSFRVSPASFERLEAPEIEVRIFRLGGLEGGAEMGDR